MSRTAELLFTGQPCKTVTYSYDGGKKSLKRGDRVNIPLDDKGKPTGHWAVLIESGNAVLLEYASHPRSSASLADAEAV